MRTRWRILLRRTEQHRRRRLVEEFQLRQLDMGAQLDLIKHVLQLGIGEGFVTAGNRRRQLVQSGAGNAAGQKPVAHGIQQVQKLFAMCEALGLALGGILHPLQHQDGIQCRDRSGTGDDLGVAFTMLRDRESTSSRARRRLALDGGCLDAAWAFDFHGKVPLRHATIPHHG